MPRQPKPADLTLLTRPDNGIPPGPISSPIDLTGVDLSSFDGQFASEARDGGVAISTAPASQPAQLSTSLPHSPPLSPRLFDREHGRGFFSTFKSKKVAPEDTIRRVQDKDTRAGAPDEEVRPGTSSISKVYHLRKAPGSTPELSLVAGAGADHLGKGNTEETRLEQDPPPLPHPQSDDHHHSEDNAATKNKSKAFRNPLARSKSIRRDSHSKSQKPTIEAMDPPPMTAPLQSDWPGAESRMFGKGKEQNRRGKSAERTASNDSEENLSGLAHSKDHKPGFMSSGKNALSKAKTGGGSFFSRLGKIGRSGSSNVSNEKEKEVPDSEYVFRVINLPLAEQTRITRISKHLQACRDKTEYWMPSLPWRCIDYLNSKCEYEGLYRVPGSGPQVKRWQRRFDTELDVDILKEDTYDVNEIASMLKAWLRELPTEIFPAVRQKELAAKLEQENPKFKNVGEPAPQLLREALSDLPPQNYYLLFAITCHLSLILGHKDQNRMDLNNLAVCVGPCLNLDRWLFNYLVGDWRNCWRGCNTEKAAQELEKRIATGAPLSERSEADLIRQDLQNEANAENAYPPAIVDDNNSAEERAMSITSGSIPNSNPTSSHNDAAAPSKPMTYIPAGARVNPDGTLGGLGVTMDPELRRPSIAANSSGPEDTGAQSRGQFEVGGESELRREKSQEMNVAQAPPRNTSLPS